MYRYLLTSAFVLASIWWFKIKRNIIIFLLFLLPMKIMSLVEVSLFWTIKTIWCTRFGNITKNTIDSNTLSVLFKSLQFWPLENDFIHAYCCWRFPLNVDVPLTTMVMIVFSLTGWKANTVFWMIYDGLFSDIVLFGTVVRFFTVV